MPKRKRSRKNVKRVTFKGRKRRKRTFSLSRVPRGILAKTFKQSFRYVDTISLDPTSGGNIVYHSFRANDLYDPDQATGGHQPMGFDQLVGVTHNNFTVIGSRIKATFMSQVTGANSGSAYVGIMKSSSAAPITTSINSIIESKSTKMRMMTNAGASQKQIVSSKMNISKYLGKKVMQEDDCAGSAGAGPVEQAFYIVCAGTNHVGLTDPANIQVLIELEYIAILHDPRQLAGS